MTLPWDSHDESPLRIVWQLFRVCLRHPRSKRCPFYPHRRSRVVVYVQFEVSKSCGFEECWKHRIVGAKTGILFCRSLASAAPPSMRSVMKTSFDWLQWHFDWWASHFLHHGVLLHPNSLGLNLFWRLNSFSILLPKRQSEMCEVEGGRTPTHPPFSRVARHLANFRVPRSQDGLCGNVMSRDLHFWSCSNRRMRLYLERCTRKERKEYMAFYQTPIGTTHPETPPPVW